MPNYTVQQALGLTDLSTQAREYLERLEKSGIPKIKGKTFTATTQANLKKLIEEYVAKKAEEDTVKLDDCLNVIRSLVKGTKDSRRPISPKDLLPKLEALRDEIIEANKFTKINKAAEASGMTEQQMFEYLQKKYGK